MDLPRSTRALLAAAREVASAPPAGEPRLIDSHRGESHLAASHPGRGDCLDVASTGAAVALALGCGYLHDHWGACRAAEAAGVTPVLHADRLPPQRFRFIFLEAAGLDPALARQFAAEAADRLEPGGALVATAHRDEVAPWFDEVTVQGDLLVARRPRAGRPDAGGPAAEPCSYSVTIGGRTLTVHSEPGVFSPRGLDPGTRALLLAMEGQVGRGRRFLDLGCGAGVVSAVASQVWNCQVTAVDVSARALRLTRGNAPGAEVLPSDGFSSLRGRAFDVIASNPPYHTDFAVARGFIEGAHRHLAPGGWLYLVVKRSDWYIQKTRAVFGGCRVSERDGYAVIAAEKREGEPAPAAARPTTRKHARRVAASARRRNHR